MVKEYFVTNRHMSAMSRSTITVGQLMADTLPLVGHLKKAKVNKLLLNDRQSTD